MSTSFASAHQASRLQAAIFAGSIKTVVVWKLDWICRQLKDGINTLAN